MKMEEDRGDVVLGSCFSSYKYPERRQFGRMVHKSEFRTDAYEVFCSFFFSPGKYSRGNRLNRQRFPEAFSYKPKTLKNL